MKVVVLDVKLHKKTAGLIERLQSPSSTDRIISVRKSRTMLRISMTTSLFIENEYLIEKANQRVRAEVFWLDTESLDRIYERKLATGDYDEEALALDYIRKVRKIPESKYVLLSEKGSPGGKFSLWQNVLYTIYHVHRIDSEGKEADD